RWPRQQVEWVHLGGGAGLDALRRQAERELPDTVHATFSGEVPNARVREHYLVSPVDVLLNVSSSEGVPVSMMEALSFGVPVVGTSVGGVPEIVNADPGILLPPDPAPEQIAAALYQFADRSGVVATMRRAAREQWCTRFDGERNFGEVVR